MIDRPDPTTPEVPRFSLPELVGRQVGGYEVLGLLGQGGMGRVYQARDLRLGRMVALKIVHAPAFLRQELFARFAREARLLSEVVHPNVAQVYSAGELEGVPWYAMEHIEGPTLGQLLERRGRLSGRQCLDYLIEAAAGLYAAAEHGVIHRDIKPSNLMLGADGHLKIVDFGLARRLDEDSSLTRSQGVLGTPRYMSPEQALGGAIDHRSDMYSLGATFYHLFAGEPPFAGTSFASVALQHIQTPLPPLRQRNPHIPGTAGHSRHPPVPSPALSEPPCGPGPWLRCTPSMCRSRSISPSRARSPRIWRPCARSTISTPEISSMPGSARSSIGIWATSAIA